MTRASETDTSCWRGPDGSATEQASADLAREMRRRWRGGERAGAEEFLARDPGLAAHPEAAVELIYEEYCLREGAGQPGVEQDLLRRFPQWAGPLRVMLDCHRRLIESDRERPQFPTVGETVGGFRLLRELHRGPHGRVFLAAQTALGGRPVVLKVTPLGGEEHVSLARLQHTNIVPLYSAFDDAERNLRFLCMPYFGRATLATVLEALAGVSPERRTGQDLIDAVEAAAGDDEPNGVAPLAGAAAAAREALGRATYADAVCWVVAGLADAVQFAHDRGVVHLDLKPSNVLLTPEGQPMLLDFHLARGPVAARGDAPEHFGGTPNYMPPEQRAALKAVEAGGEVPEAVDGRADVYALGAILYESLGGKPPSEDAPPLERVNPAVSRGLSDVVAKCLATLPERRYADPRSLADDLRRHLASQPLAGVPNRSLAERWRKWRTRRPGALRAIAIAALLVLAAAALLAGAWRDERRRGGAAGLPEAERRASLREIDEVVQTLARAARLKSAAPSDVVKDVPASSDDDGASQQLGPAED